MQTGCVFNLTRKTDQALLSQILFRIAWLGSNACLGLRNITDENQTFGPPELALFPYTLQLANSLHFKTSCNWPEIFQPKRTFLKIQTLFENGEELLYNISS